MGNLTKVQFYLNAKLIKVIFEELTMCFKSAKVLIRKPFEKKRIGITNYLKSYIGTTCFE